MARCKYENAASGCVRAIIRSLSSKCTQTHAIIEIDIRPTSKEVSSMKAVTWQD